MNVSIERPFLNQPTRVNFIQQALNNLEESRSVFTTLEFLRKLLLTYKPDNSGQQVYSKKQESAEKVSREEIVMRILKEDIFQKVIVNVALYQDFARINLSQL